MSNTKRDKKGRVLLKGERQRRDGRYEYRYVDETGATRSVYSWRLVQSDRVPIGCKDIPLRDLEKRIRRDIEDNINSYSAYKQTLNSFFDVYMSTKTELKESTRSNYIYMYNRFVRDSLGNKVMTNIKYSDVKKFYLYLIDELGLKPRSMEIINTILHPVFSLAVRDGAIRSNPVSGAMNDIRRSHTWEREKRHALTEEQQKAFINYCKTCNTFKKWVPIFTLLLGTGARIGEALGLRWCDCNFDTGIISINHSLLYRQGSDGLCQKHVSTTKTKSGTRVVPMLSEVKHTLLEYKMYQLTHGGLCTEEIDGYSGFIFRNRYNDVMTPSSVNRAIDRICSEYNRQETNDAEKENREPVLLPRFSAHNLRHTFCTRFCEVETNLKVIQEIMGHADITTTMNIYNEATIEKKIESFANIQCKFSIG